jgi:hypothetical protein
MYFQRRSTNRCFVSGLILFAPLIAQAGAISVNSTCEVGDCTPAGLAADAIGDEESTSGTFNFNFSFGDGDQYNVAGTYGASYSTSAGTAIGVDPVITYIGGAPSVGTDTLNFSLLQDYFDPSCCTWAGTYFETVPLISVGSFGPGSEMSGELLVDAESVGLVGPYSSPGSYLVTTSTFLDFGAADTNAILSDQFNIYDTFGAGTLPGASQSASPTPEGRTAILCGLGLLVWGYRMRRRNRSVAGA